MMKSRMEPISQKFCIFNALSLSCLLYCSHIWGLRYMDEIEKVQNAFLRRLFNLSQGSPNYAMRLEAGRNPLKVRVIKQALTFIIKILDMDDDRYAKKCYNKLLSLSQNPHEKSQYNWVLQIQQLLDPVISPSQFTTFESQDLVNRRQGIVDAHKLILYQQDLDRVNSSSSYSYYANFFCAINSPALYLQLPMPIYIPRLITQCRISNGRFKLSSKISLVLNLKDQCTICNLDEANSLFHILFRCPLNTSSRSTFLNSIPNSNELLTNDKWYTFLDIQNKPDLTKLYHFIYECLMNIFELPDP